MARAYNQSGCYQRILSDQEVIEIRLFCDEGWTVGWGWGGAEAIGLAYNVRAATIRGIGCRKNRANIPERWRVSRRR